MRTSCWRLFAVASLALTASLIPSASARPLRSTLAKQLMEAKKSGASKEDLQKLKLKIKDEMMTAKAAGVTIDVSLSIV